MKNTPHLLPNTIKRMAVMYPSGNTTAVIFDKELMDIPRKLLNDTIMKSWKLQFPNKPEIEQCCFVSSIEANNELHPITRMDMFGGEFCGNATRSVIQLVTKGLNSAGTISVSGTEDKLSFNVNDRIITVEIPMSKNRPTYQKVEEGMLVHLEGISQLVIEDETGKKFEEGHSLLHKLLNTNKYDLNNEPAVGISYYEPKTSSARFIVWVDEVKTVDDETACGSGTSAIGIAMAIGKGHSVKALPVKQPSGLDISTSALLDQDQKSVLSTHISGTVQTLFDGEFYLTFSKNYQKPSRIWQRLYNRHRIS